MSALAVNSLFDDRFIILEAVDAGGMGTIYKARDCRTSEVFALKVLNACQLEENEDRARFKLEGKILEKIAHPNIVRFFGYNIYRDKLPYLVMEYLGGKSLRSVLNDKIRLSPAETLRILMQVCDALACVHAMGIVHRDIKPNNVLVLNENAGVKLIDFGVSRVLENSSVTLTRQLTQTGLLIGTVYYMAPEQCLGRRVDHRADLYAVGCMMYEMLTGQRPFSAPNPVALLQKHLNETAPSLSEFIPADSLPKGLQNVLDKAMAKELDERFQDAAEMRNALSAVLEGKGYADKSAAVTGRAADNDESTRGKMIYACLVVVMAICLVVLIVLHLQSKTQP